MTGIVPFAILAPPLVDCVKERAGHYDHALLALAALGLLGAVICLMLRKPRPGSPGRGKSVESFGENTRKML